MRVRHLCEVALPDAQFPRRRPHITLQIPIEAQPTRCAGCADGLPSPPGGPVKQKPLYHFCACYLKRLGIQCLVSASDSGDDFFGDGRPFEAFSEEQFDGGLEMAAWTG